MTKYIDQEPLVLAQDWDYLIILDACRYDTFEEVNNIPGTLIPVWSPGSRTPKWVEKVFVDGSKWKDIVIVSGCQFTARLSDIFKHHRNSLLEDWDDKANTISAKNINRATIEILEQFPNDKMIIWYMQPHVPFIGKTRIGHDTLQLLEKEVLLIRGMVRHFQHDVEYVYNAYKENLEYVLDYVKKLLPHLSGKVIITSDHGNGFGELGYYFGHEDGSLNHECVRLVPWLEVDMNE